MTEPVCFSFTSKVVAESGSPYPRARALVTRAAIELQFTGDLKQARLDAEAAMREHAGSQLDDLCRTIIENCRILEKKPGSEY